MCGTECLDCGISVPVGNAVDQGLGPPLLSTTRATDCLAILAPCHLGRDHLHVSVDNGPHSGLDLQLQPNEGVLDGVRSLVEAQVSLYRHEMDQSTHEYLVCCERSLRCRSTVDPAATTADGASPKATVASAVWSWSYCRSYLRVPHVGDGAVWIQLRPDLVSSYESLS
jgi:hypothetical protein